MLNSLWLRARTSVAGACGAAVASCPPFRFVASDMDGTVLSPHHTLSEYTTETLRRLTQELHVPFIFATGRVYADVAIIHREMQRTFEARRQEAPLTPATTEPRTPTYIISSNGAAIHDAETGELVYEHPVDPAIVRELYHLLPVSETRINTGIIQGEHWFYRMNWEEMLRFHKQSGYRFRVLESIPEKTAMKSTETEGFPPVSSSAVAGCLHHVHKIFFSSWDRPRLEKLEAMLQQRYGKDLTVTFSSSYNVDITGKGVTKASALERLYSVMPPLPHEAASSVTSEQRLKHTVAFGDDLNDAAMLNNVGLGFVMGNCNPKLVERCPHLSVIQTNAEDGVARKLAEVFHLE